MGTVKRNELVDEMGALYASTSKPVLAAVLMSVLRELVDAGSIEDERTEIVRVWADLHVRGIVPQRPPNAERYEDEARALFEREERLTAIASAAGGDDPMEIEAALDARVREGHEDLRWFRFSHLHPHVAAVSARFAGVAVTLPALAAGRQRDEAVQRLIEAKDAAVRAALDTPPQESGEDA